MSKTTVNVEEQIDHRASIKEQIELLNKRLTDVNKTILEALDAQGLDRLTTTLGNKVVVVEQTITDVNPDLLKDRLTTGQWNKVTERKLNKVLLDAQVTVGAIDQSVVAECTFVVAEKRYLR